MQMRRVSWCRLLLPCGQQGESRPPVPSRPVTLSLSTDPAVEDLELVVCGQAGVLAGQPTPVRRIPPTRGCIDDARVSLVRAAFIFEMPKSSTLTKSGSPAICNKKTLAGFKSRWTTSLAVAHLAAGGVRDPRHRGTPSPDRARQTVPCRVHQALGGQLIKPRDASMPVSAPVCCRSRLGGMLNYYHREAA
jgi:hypothetical protein